MPGTLYVVATPLGNLEDITLRALRILKEVDLIAAEDTRHSRKLLDHFGIRKPILSYYDQVERRKAPELIARLVRGESIALISDAGTPAIADPGYRLVRAAIDAEVCVVPVPGPSAVMAALSAAGLPTDRFTFEGFVPARSAARRKFYDGLRSETRTIVSFEAGRRIVASLEDLRLSLGDRQVVIARELTKLYESFGRGSVRELLEAIPAGELRGEVTLLIAGASDVSTSMSAAKLEQQIRRLRSEGMGTKEIAAALVEVSGKSQREIYAIAVRIDGNSDL